MSTLKISTVTANAKLDCSIQIRDPDLIEFIRPHVVFKEPKKKKNAKDDKRKFFNSLMFTLHDIHVKVFQNGSVCLAGIKLNKMPDYPYSGNDINELIMKKINKQIKRIFKLLKKAEKALENSVVFNSDAIINPHITMINSNYKLFTEEQEQYVVNQHNLKDIINSLYKIENGGFWKGAVKTDRYPGLNTKFWSSHARTLDTSSLKKNAKTPGEISVMVFRSGNIIITGCKNFNWALEAYNDINAIILKHFDNICFVDII